MLCIYMNIYIIIPAYNEEDSIEKVIREIPADYVDRVIVVDNASTDATEERAVQAGAHVVYESRRGYGQACLRGIDEALEADIIVFLDADFSDDPSVLPELVKPIIDNEADLVIGSRSLGEHEPGAFPVHAQLGNWLACWLIRILFGERFTDLGPFRAIRRTSLQSLNMQDVTYGWTVEMQGKAAILHLRCMEIPVPYKKRIGKSKISGTISGSVKAGYMILWTIFRLWLQKNKL